MTRSDHEDAAFVAAITASTTHEIRNVLAIVKESAGLIADMVDVCDQGGRLDRDRFMRVVSRIDTQVNRGSELITSLNRFAHSLDEIEGAIDLNGEVEQVAFLSQRFVRQRNQSVEVAAPDGGPQVSVSPFRLQMALFAAVECSSDQLSDGGSLVLRAGIHQGHPAVEVTGTVEGTATPVASPAAPAWPRLEQLVEDLAGSLAVEEDGHRLWITLPAGA